MASRFSLAAYNVRLFDSHFKLLCFSGIKYILPRKMRQNPRESDNNNNNLCKLSVYFRQLTKLTKICTKTQKNIKVYHARRHDELRAA